MGNPRYNEAFNIQAVNQVTEKKLPVADGAARLGRSTHSAKANLKRRDNMMMISTPTASPASRTQMGH